MICLYQTADFFYEQQISLEIWIVWSYLQNIYFNFLALLLNERLEYFGKYTIESEMHFKSSLLAALNNQFFL